MIEEQDDEPASLNMLAEKIAPQPVNGEQLAYCPTMDLIALGTRDDQVQVFRLNGQRVFGAASGPKSLKIYRLHWKPTGELMCSPPRPKQLRILNRYERSFRQ